MNTEDTSKNNIFSSFGIHCITARISISFIILVMKSVKLHAQQFKMSIINLKGFYVFLLLGSRIHC